MARLEDTINFLQATDAQFRTWVDDLRDDIVAVGLVQTADTGQIDTTTVLAPTAANQNRGYMMFRSDDALTNWYMKIEFGSATYGALSPWIRISFGWTTDGAGTFTGLQKSAVIIPIIAGANNGLTAAVCWFCYSGGAFAMCLNQTKTTGTNGMNWLITCDRYRDETGAPNTDGFQITACCDSNGGYLNINAASSGSRNMSHAVPASGGVPNFEATEFTYPVHPIRTTTWSRAGRIGLVPVGGWDGGPTPLTIASVIYLGLDMTNGTIFKCSMHGVEHEFRATNVNASTYAVYFAMLWDD